MGETEPSRDRTAVDPEEAFRLLGHEIRVQILLALWRASDHALGFSELYDAVDVDDSGQFTYHLSKLEGRSRAGRTRDGLH
ncbi:helix-turn-helix transcriptional regulator [Haloterrigena salifodinae]|uniref:Helix-turn-helix transcriptional regulator n=1 Tax=Haloterrigena salifodinae TaxID=2675099 RepID=A0A8T8DWV4_9EURY|nr:helix-turn-helix transcriptional regulator [Haloterrigena salifodinae]QRV14078.1 helix-turn-helix transcriptional regulator [Haloterrigena salifodinae]